MKPTNEKTYRKFRIQTIVNPGCFFAVKYGREAQNEDRLHITQIDVEGCKTQDIRVGQIVAVKYENNLHRGLITDTYKRFMRPIFNVWLLDKGSNIESSSDKIYKLKNPELRNKKICAYEINLYGVKPTTVDILLNSPNLIHDSSSKGLNGMFYLRESDTWTPGSVNFVNNLFDTNKSIYVHSIDVHGRRILGNVYYREGKSDVLKSLARTLCEKNFAITADRGKILVKDYSQGGRFLNQAEFIPNLSNLDEWEELRTLNVEPKSKFKSDSDEEKAKSSPRQEAAGNIFHSGGNYFDEDENLPRVSMSEEWEDTVDWEEYSTARRGGTSDSGLGAKDLSSGERSQQLGREEEGLRRRSPQQDVAGCSSDLDARSLRTTDKVPMCFVTGDWRNPQDPTEEDSQEGACGGSSKPGNSSGCPWCDKTPCLVKETFVKDPKKQGSASEEASSSSSRGFTESLPSTSSQSFSEVLRKLALGEKSGPKVNLLRIVEKNVQLFDRHKKVVKSKNSRGRNTHV